MESSVLFQKAYFRLRVECRRDVVLPTYRYAITLLSKYLYGRNEETQSFKTSCSAALPQYIFKTQLTNVIYLKT